MRPGASPSERFKGWFVESVAKLRELPEGDGAFATMMIVLPLYERYIIANLKLSGSQTGEEEITREIGADLGLDEAQRRIFWEMFRNGFMHQAMVKAGQTQWAVSDRFGALPEFRLLNGQRCVCVDPWKFADRVLEAFVRDPRLIAASESFPLAEVFPLRSDAFSPEVQP
jgi:hypothetical protein